MLVEWVPLAFAGMGSLENMRWPCLLTFRALSRLGRCGSVIDQHCLLVFLYGNNCGGESVRRARAVVACGTGKWGLRGSIRWAVAARLDEVGAYARVVEKTCYL